MIHLLLFGIGIFLILILLLYLSPLFIVHIKPGVKVKQSFIDTLSELEDSALAKGEYPIACLLIYKDQVIASGINTIRHKNEPLGHAEMNTLKQALEKMSIKEFKQLDSEELILLISWEPCPMCRSTMEYLNIRKIYCMKTKKFSWELDYRKKGLKYYFHLRKVKR